MGMAGRGDLLAGCVRSPREMRRLPIRTARIYELCEMIAVPDKALMGASLSLCVAACARVGEAARRRIRAADLLKLARVVGIGGDILLRRIKNWSAEPPTQP